MDTARDLAPLAERVLRASGMQSAGLYTFDDAGRFEAGVIVGMPDAFVRAYEAVGIPSTRCWRGCARAGRRARR